jgi:hypothetical protein
MNPYAVVIACVAWLVVWSVALAAFRRWRESR